MVSLYGAAQRFGRNVAPDSATGVVGNAAEEPGSIPFTVLDRARATAQGSGRRTFT